MSVSAYSRSAGLNVSISGINIAEGMARDDVDDAIRQQMADTREFYDLVNSEDLGVLPAGGTIRVNQVKTFTGAPGGSTDFRSTLISSKLQGPNSAVQNHCLHLQAENQATAGTLTYLRACEAYARHGLAAAAAGTLTAARVFEAHIANESLASAITSAITFYANDTDFADDYTTTGTIGTNIAFHAGNHGHATKCTTEAVGFSCADMTAGSPKTAAFRSQMSSGTNKWAFLSEGSAKSAHAGAMRFGDNTAPGDILEVKGYVKLSEDGSKQATGSYHELNTTRNDYISHFKNTHATAPHGLRVRFTGASPNNTTQQFLLCEDSTTSRLIIYSNGSVVNSLNSYGAISDKTLKTGIRDAGSQLDDIRAIKVRKYRLKSEGEDAPELLGVVAQEVEKVSPGLVFETKQGKKKIKGVNYSVLYMKAFKALQEAVEIIDKQGKDIEWLKAEIAAIKAKP